MSDPKLNIKEETSTKKNRSPPKKTKVEQSVPKKKKLKTDADKAAEKAQHLRFGKAELTPDELSRLSKAQKREMYVAHAARSTVHHEVDQYEDENVGVQALSEGEKAVGNIRDISKSRYARKLKKKAKMQAKKKARTTKSSTRQPDKAQNAGDSNIPHGDSNEGGSNWLSRWKQRQEIRKGYYAAARSGTAAQTAGGKAASNGACICRPVQHGTGGRKGQNCRQHCRERAGECRQEQRTRFGDRGRFSFAHSYGDVGLLVLRYPLFGRHTGVRADHVLC